MVEETSRRVEIVYEQCPWDQAHVLALYKRLEGTVLVDNEWHRFPKNATSFGYYRVTEQRYFQALFTTESHQVLEPFKVLTPLPMEHDAEWTIWEDEESLADGYESGYVITSVFAVTPGPFPHQGEAHEWLNRHALGFEAHEFHVQGIARFAKLNSAELLDAINRLHWLERVFRDLNQRIEDYSEQFWSTVKGHSDAALALSDEDPESDYILPVPAIYPQIGRSGKRRTPIGKNDVTKEIH